MATGVAQFTQAGSIMGRPDILLICSYRSRDNQAASRMKSKYKEDMLASPCQTFSHCLEDVYSTSSTGR